MRDTSPRMLKVNSRQEAIEWAKRVPNPHPGTESEIELRQVFELEDFAPSEALDHHREVEKQIAKNK